MTKKNRDENEVPPLVVRKCTDYLRVDYTPEELAVKAQDLAAKVKALANVQAEKTSVMASFTGKIKGLEGEVSCLTEQVSGKGEHRTIKCEWHMNTPSRGRKTCFRTDNGSAFREEEMLDNDCQMVMDDLKDRNGTTERGVEEKEATEVQ